MPAHAIPVFALREKRLDLFEYISVLTSIIVGLGMAHLLRGLAQLVQHPDRHEVYWVHLLWVGFMFLYIIFFWWWEFALAGKEIWHFRDYVFIVVYAVILYLMCAMLFPNDLDGYNGYADYFLSRRAWFFGLFAMTTIMDVYDTILKGMDHFSELGTAYVMLTATFIVFAILGAATRRHSVHVGIVVLALAYQTWYALQYWSQQA
jgi:hypothetical protein